MVLVVVVLAFVFGCKKDPVAPPAPEEKAPEPKEVIGEVVSNLKTADTISVFVDALKGLELTAADVEEGSTVFAPLNEEEAREQQALTMGARAAIPSIQAFATGDLTASVLKDHIGKGVMAIAYSRSSGIPRCYL